MQNTQIGDQANELKFPMDPRSILINYSKYLLDIEKTEILDYETIYFFDLQQRKEKNMEDI